MDRYASAVGHAARCQLMQDGLLMAEQVASAPAHSSTHIARHRRGQPEPALSRVPLPAFQLPVNTLTHADPTWTA